MDKLEAKQLVKKLIDTAYTAGQYAANPESLLLKEKSEKALKLGDELIRYLIDSKDTKESCLVCSGCIRSGYTFCSACGRKLRGK